MAGRRGDRKHLADRLNPIRFLVIVDECDHDFAVERRLDNNTLTPCEDSRVYYLLDMVRGRYEYPELRDTAIALAERYKPFAILIEDASTGTALAQELKQAGLYPVRLIPIHHDKRGRLYVSQGKFERGQVQFPMGQPFMSEVEKELLSFPQGKTDDIVDSISQALAFDDWGYDSTLSWV